MKLKRFIQISIVVLLLSPVTAFSAGWTWQNPLPQGNFLMNVWGSSGSDVFNLPYSSRQIY